MKNNLTDFQKEFIQYLKKYSQQLNTRQAKELYHAIQYILDSDAKYIRPLLCLLACELYGKPYKHALPAALSIELFHTFSLVHDDILDQSSIRRGKKTIHTKWNTNLAILSGDLLLIEAYKCLTQYPEKISHQLFKLFLHASVEICEGQQEDMNFEKISQISTLQYIEMIRKKTSVLLGTALQMGAIIANANITEQKKLYQTGENIGIAFQIMDDYLDTFGNPKTFGKKIGNDILNNKKTYLLTTAFEMANKKQIKEIKSILKLPPSNQKIKLLKNLFIELNVHKQTLHTIEQYHQKINNQINLLKAKNTLLLNLLLQFSNQLKQRTK